MNFYKVVTGLNKGNGRGFKMGGQKMNSYDLKNFTDLEVAVLYFILSSGSEEKPVTSAKITKKIGLVPKDVRDVIHSLREKQVQVCSGCRGYYIAENNMQVTKTIRHLRSRSNKINKVADALHNSIQ